MDVLCVIFFFSMGATLFVQPLDLVKNRMQLAGMSVKNLLYILSCSCLVDCLVLVVIGWFLVNALTHQSHLEM